MRDQQMRARAALREGAGELVILLAGGLASVLAALFVSDPSIGALAAVLTILIAASSYQVRAEMSARIADASRIHNAVREIDNADWRRSAYRLINELESELIGWSRGIRNIPPSDSISYQINRLEKSERRVDAIHVALDLRRLKVWDRESSSFNAIVECYERMSESVSKCRILVLDDDDPNMFCSTSGRRTIGNPLVLSVCRKQIYELGTDLFILWKSDLKKVDDGLLPPDLLIVDDSEAIVVRFVEDQVFETTAYAGPVYVEAQRSVFQRYKNVSTPAKLLLPQSDQKQGPDIPPTNWKSPSVPKALWEAWNRRRRA